jgi:tetratricopeptide (TPR) repeat protein
MGHTSRAYVLGSLDRFDEALAEAELALELDPNNASAHYNRGLGLRATGHPWKALVAFRRATELDPGAGQQQPGT